MFKQAAASSCASRPSRPSALALTSVAAVTVAGRGGAGAGEVLASASTDKDIQVWHACGGEEGAWGHAATLSGHAGSVVALACNASQACALASKRRMPAQPPRLAASPPRLARASPDQGGGARGAGSGQALPWLLASGSYDRTIRLWHLAAPAAPAAAAAAAGKDSDGAALRGSSLSPCPAAPSWPPPLLRSSAPPLPPSSAPPLPPSARLRRACPAAGRFCGADVTLLAAPPPGPLPAVRP